MTHYFHPTIQNAGASPLDDSIGKLLFMFKQLQPWQIDAIVMDVRQILPIAVTFTDEEALQEDTRFDAAQRGVVQLLYMIAPQTYPDILIALTYAEALALLKGADADEDLAAVH